MENESATMSQRLDAMLEDAQAAREQGHEDVAKALEFWERSLRATVQAPHVLVTVEGGVLTGVRSTVPGVQVTLRDFDNINAGDEDPLADFRDADFDPDLMQASEDSIDWEASGFVHNVY
jgi:hypothetical protein